MRMTGRLPSKNSRRATLRPLESTKDRSSGICSPGWGSTFTLRSSAGAGSMRSAGLGVSAAKAAGGASASERSSAKRRWNDRKSLRQHVIGPPLPLGKGRGEGTLQHGPESNRSISTRFPSPQPSPEGRGGSRSRYRFSCFVPFASAAGFSAAFFPDASGRVNSANTKSMARSMGIDAIFFFASQA